MTLRRRAGAGTELLEQAQRVELVPALGQPAAHEAVDGEAGHGTARPVGESPLNSPRCVPRIDHRTATFSPCTTRSWTVKCASGKAERKAAMNRRSPFRPAEPRAARQVVDVVGGDQPVQPVQVPAVEHLVVVPPVLGDHVLGATSLRSLPFLLPAHPPRRASSRHRAGSADPPPRPRHRAAPGAPPRGRRGYRTGGRFRTRAVAAPAHSYRSAGSGTAPRRRRQGLPGAEDWRVCRAHGIPPGRVRRPGRAAPRGGGWTNLGDGGPAADRLRRPATPAPAGGGAHPGGAGRPRRGQRARAAAPGGRRRPAHARDVRGPGRRPEPRAGGSGAARGGGVAAVALRRPRRGGGRAGGPDQPAGAAEQLRRAGGGGWRPSATACYAPMSGC